MQIPPCLIVDKWSNRIKIYPKISKLPLSELILESKIALKIQGISN